jgi:hypothetical protein
MAQDRRHEIARDYGPGTEDIWTLVFDEKKKVWCVEHIWDYRETRSRGKRTLTLEEFEKTVSGKRLAAEVQAAAGRAADDA